ncbi:MAG: hypothetical protein ACPGUZ_03490 [Holosporaceae bacterium]
MKISIYLASFVLLKAMMPGALYAPPPNGDENGSDDVKTTIAASAPAAPNIVTKEDIEALKQQNKEMQSQITQLVTLVQSMQNVNAVSDAPAASNAPPAPPPPPPVQPAPQPTALKPTLHKKKKTPEEEAEDKRKAAAAESVNEINKFLKDFSAGQSVSGTLRKHKQKGSSKPSVQAVFGSGNSAPGNTQSGSGKTQESGHAQKLSVQDHIKSLQEQQSPQESVKPKIAAKPAGLTARSSVSAAETKSSEPVVDSAENLVSAESGEMNGSAATEAAPAAEAQITETASASEETLSVKDLRAKFAQNAQDSVAKPTVQEKAQHSAQTPVKKLQQS